MTITLYANNTVSIDERIVGRIDKRDAHARGRFSTPRPVRFYTGKPGTFDQLHEISADTPLYIGGPSDWKINPAFERAVREIVGL